METAVLTGAETSAAPVQALTESTGLIQAGALAAAFKAVKPGLCPESRAVNPVLTYCRLRMADGAASLEATDGGFTIQVPVAGDCDGELDILLPGKLTREALLAIPADALACLTVRSNGKEAACRVEGGGRSFTLGALWPENYPENGAAGELVMRLPVPVLRNALELTCFAAIKEGGTGGIHYTNGVFLACRAGECDVVATDGHRLSLVELRGIADTGFDFESLQSAKRGEERPNKGLLVPARVACDLLKALPACDDPGFEVEVCSLKNTATFSLAPGSFSKGKREYSFTGFTLTTRLLDVKFPDYLRVMPARDSIAAKVHCFRAQLVGALKAGLPLTRAKDQNPVVRLAWTDERLTLKSDGGSLGESETSIPCVASAAGEIAVNPQYLIDVLTAGPAGEQVTLSWVDAVNPVMVGLAIQPDFRYIVMPIRLDK